MIKRLIQIASIALIILGVESPFVQAEEIGGYTIEGVPNAKQIDPDLGYFYLNEGIGAKDKLKVKLINSSDKAKKLQVKVTNANTNSNGLLDYTGNLKDNKSLKIPLTSIVKVSQSEVTVPPKSESETTLDVTMPSHRFSGVIIGGVVVSEKDEDQLPKTETNVSVKNTYSYTIGVVLTNDPKSAMKKNSSVSLEKVAPVLSDGRKIIQADILNPNPYIFGEAIVSGEILEKSTNKLVKKQEKTNINIAPYSVYPFQFDWKKEDLKAGKYLFTGTVRAGGKEWRLKKAFEITSSAAEHINEKSIYHVVIPIWLKVSMGIFIILNVIGTAYLIIIKKRNPM